MRRKSACWIGVYGMAGEQSCLKATTAKIDLFLRARPDMDLASNPRRETVKALRADAPARVYGPAPTIE